MTTDRKNFVPTPPLPHRIQFDNHSYSLSQIALPHATELGSIAILTRKHKQFGAPPPHIKQKQQLITKKLNEINFLSTS